MCQYDESSEHHRKGLLPLSPLPSKPTLLLLPPPHRDLVPKRPAFSPSARSDRVYPEEDSYDGDGDTPRTGASPWSTATPSTYVSRDQAVTETSASERLQGEQMGDAAAEGDDGSEPPLEEKAKSSNKPIFLRTEDNLFVPYVMHIGEIAGSVTLVVLSKGKHGPVSEMLFKMLDSLQHLLELVTSLAISVEQETHKSQSQWSTEHIAVRGAAEEAFSVTVINGNYLPLVEPVNGKTAYERTAKDAYLFYDDRQEAWIIAPELGRSEEWSARIVSSASCPDLALHMAKIQRRRELEEQQALDDRDGAAAAVEPGRRPLSIVEELEDVLWEVRTRDSAAVLDPGLEARCVRGDGAMRNTEGRFASISASNGLYYCGGPSVCTCGSCDTTCGPEVGCNCSACRQLGEVGGFGNMELVARYSRNRRDSKLSREERVKAIKKQTAAVETWLQKLLGARDNFLSNNGRERLEKHRSFLRKLVKQVKHGRG